MQASTACHRLLSSISQFMLAEWSQGATDGAPASPPSSPSPLQGLSDMAWLAEKYFLKDDLGASPAQVWAGGSWAGGRKRLGATPRQASCGRGVRWMRPRWAVPPLDTTRHVSFARPLAHPSLPSLYASS